MGKGLYDTKEKILEWLQFYINIYGSIEKAKEKDLYISGPVIKFLEEEKLDEAEKYILEYEWFNATRD